MAQPKVKELEGQRMHAPRFEQGKAMLITGFRSHYTDETRGEIPSLWQRFAPHIGKIPGQVGAVAYGLCFDTSGGANGFDYMAGVEVSGTSGLANDFSVATIPAQKYAVFTHNEHLSKLCETFDFIWNTWLPKSGHQVVIAGGNTPDLFERYGEKFDPIQKMGDVEVWIPVKS